MSVFDANTVTATAPLSGSDATIDSLLLGQGQASTIATDNFFQAVTNMQPGNEQLQTDTGDVSEFIDGKVNLAINSDFVDFVYGSLYSVTMGTSTSLVVGKQRGWYRTLPDSDTTLSSYYTDIDNIDPTIHPGYDTGATYLEAKSVFNNTLLQYQWAGLTQVRLVDDNILYGSAQEPITTSDFQYGGQTVRVKGSNTTIMHGDSFATYQGNRTAAFTSAAHIVIVLGADLTSQVGHESSKTTQGRLNAVEQAFQKAENAALAGVTPPPSTHVTQWSDIGPSASQRFPMSFDMTWGLGIIVNANAEFLFGVLRNAISLIGMTARVFDLDEKQGEALLAALKTKASGLIAGLSAISTRVGGLFLGMLRIIPTPPPTPEEVELNFLPAALGDALPTAEGEFVGGVMDAIGNTAEELEAAAAALESAAWDQTLADAMAALNEETAAEAEAAAWEQTLADAMEALNEETAAEAATAQAEQVGLNWTKIVAGLAAAGGIVGGTLAGTHSGEHLPDSQLGQSSIDSEGDTSGPGGFEISNPTSSS